MKQRVSMGNTGQAIVITHVEFDEDGFAIGQKAGILPIESGRDETKMLEIAASFRWKLTGRQNIQGFFGVKKDRALSEAEKATWEIPESGRSITVKLDADEQESRDVIQSGTNTASRIATRELVTK